MRAKTRVRTDQISTPRGFYQEERDDRVARCSEPGSIARVKQLANSKQEPQARSRFPAGRPFVRRPDVSCHQHGDSCNLFALEVARRAASDLEGGPATSGV